MLHTRYLNTEIHRLINFMMSCVPTDGLEYLNCQNGDSGMQNADRDRDLGSCSVEAGPEVGVLAKFELISLRTCTEQDPYTFIHAVISK